MTRISYYLFRQLAVATLFVTAALAMAIWLTQSLRLIELVVDGGAPFWLFLWLMALTLPTFLGVVLPIGLAGAVLFTYNRLMMDSELVVMRAAGFGPWALARPALALATLIMVVVFGLNLEITPAAHRHLVKLEYLIRTEYSSVFLRQGAFNDVADHVTIYTRDRHSDGELTGIMVHDSRTPGRPITLMAERGMLVTGPVGARVILFNGIREEVGEKPGQVSHLYFDRYAIDLQVFKPELGERWIEPRERTTWELLHPTDNPSDQARLSRFVAEFHMRLSTPFFAIAFTMIGLAALLSGDFNRRGQARRMAVAVAAVFLLQAAGLGFANLASKHILVAPLLYMTVWAPIGIGAWLMLRRPRPVPPGPGSVTAA